MFKNLWNVKNLEPPSVTTYKAFTDVGKLRSQFQEALQCFSNQKYLKAEAALLSRCIYRMKTKFRSDKGLKSMEKLNHALLQYNYIKFHEILGDFYLLLPENASSESYLPTRNMLDYILVRLQGVMYLLCRILEIAEMTTVIMDNRICIGQFWKVALIVLALVSRIWIICRNIIRQGCKFYKNTIAFRYILKNVGNTWLPDDYVFPDNLEEWLNTDCIDAHEVQFKLFKQKIPICNISNDSDIEDCGEYLQIKVDETIHIHKSINQECDPPTMFDLLIQDEDLGEVIKPVDNYYISKKGLTGNTHDSKKKKGKRVFNKDIFINKNGQNDINITLLKQNQKYSINQEKIDIATKLNSRGKHKKNILLFDQINKISSINELKILFASESSRRKKGKSRIFTNLDQLQWTMLQKLVKKLLKKNHKNELSDTECIKELKSLLKVHLQ